MPITYKNQTGSKEMEIGIGMKKTRLTYMGFVASLICSRSHMTNGGEK